MIHQFLLKNKTVISTQSYDYVDLGLPSGLLWARCNIGADKPTDYGDYFIWGSTKSNTNDPCNLAHAPFNNGSDDYDEIYFNSVNNTVCPMGTLAPQYDAASVVLGNDWRLPTYDDFNELLNNTTNTWVTNYQNSNINGKLFKSKTDDSKTLFIPASGYRVGYSFFDRGSDANLWSSSLHTDGPDYSRYLYFDDSSCCMDIDLNYYGFCLRAVKES